MADKNFSAHLKHFVLPQTAVQSLVSLTYLFDNINTARVEILYFYRLQILFFHAATTTKYSSNI